MLGIFYLVLLVIGLIGFVLHLFAQFRVAHIMRKRYPQQWDIVSASDGRGSHKLRTYAHLQQVLRSNVPELFNDAQLTRWHKYWRYAPWVAWPCWIAAVALRVYVTG